MKKRVFHNIFLGFGILLFVGVIIGAVEIIENVLKPGDTIPNHLQIKAEPQNVIHSRAYKTERGTNEVTYAYLDTEVPPQEGEIEELRTPSSQTELLDIFEDTEGELIGELRTTFIAAPQFYKDNSGVWRQIEYATTTQEMFSRSGAIPHIVRREFLERVLGVTPVFADTSTFYPDPSVESTSVDGDISYTGAASFTSAVNAATGTAVDDSGTGMTASSRQFNEPMGGPTSYNVSRMVFLFDTSSLTSSATISSAVLSLYITSATDSDDDGADTINIITTSPASNTALTTADFDQVTSTLQASAVDITSISTSAYLDFTLNATGRGNISKTAVTKFGAREGHDIADSSPAAGVTGVSAATAETSGTTQDPKLVVTYTLPAVEIELKKHDVFWFD